MTVSTNLPFTLQQICNRPLMVTPAHAAMIVAALHGRLGINELQFPDSYGNGATMDPRAMDDLAAMGRLEAREKKKKSGSPHPGVSREGSDNGDKWCPYEMTESGIAVLPVQGTLKRTWGVGPYSGCTGYDGLWTQLLHALANDDVKAIWMNHNSGGGAVDGCFDLAQGIYANNEKNGGKPIWAMAADHSYSASYLLACAADKVFVPFTGGVGSIGCCVIHAEMSQALEDDGIKATIFRSGDRKHRGNALEPLDEQTIKDIQTDVDTAAEYFFEHVALFRGKKALTKKTVAEMQGAEYMGRRALATGLVDEVLSEPEAWMKLERYIARK